MDTESKLWPWRLYRIHCRSRHGNEPPETLLVTTDALVWQWVAEFQRLYPMQEFWVETVEIGDRQFIADTLNALAASEAGEPGVPFEEVKRMAEKGGADEGTRASLHLFAPGDTPTKQWDGRVKERATEDIFFCEGCLDYRRVLVRVEEPDPYRFGWREVHVTDKWSGV